MLLQSMYDSVRRKFERFWRNNKNPPASQDLCRESRGQCQLIGGGVRREKLEESLIYPGWRSRARTHFVFIFLHDNLLMNRGQPFLLIAEEYRLCMGSEFVSQPWTWCCCTIVRFPRDGPSWSRLCAENTALQCCLTSSAAVALQALWWGTDVHYAIESKKQHQDWKTMAIFSLQPHCIAKTTL